LHKITKNSINPFDFYVNVTVKKHLVETPAGKDRAARELYLYIDDLSSDIKKEEYLKLIAEKLDIDVTTVIRDYQRNAAGEKREEGHGNVKSEHIAIDAELYLLIAVTVNHQYFSVIRSNLEIDDFQNRYAKELYIILEECFRKGNLNVDDIVVRIPHSGLKQRILQAAAQDEFDPDKIENIVRESMNNLKIKSMEKRREILHKQIKKAEKNNAPFIEMNELLEEKMFLDRELEKLKVGENV
jgi:DNA primase